MSGGGWTPGPWQVAGCRHSGDLKIGRDTRLLAVGPDGDAVAMVFFDMKTGRGQRDARLIASAPTLVEVLREARASLRNLGNQVGGLNAFETEIRVAAGNTNWQCVVDAVARADAVLTRIDDALSAAGGGE